MALMAAFAPDVVARGLGGRHYRGRRRVGSGGCFANGGSHGRRVGRGLRPSLAWRAFAARLVRRRTMTVLVTTAARAPHLDELRFFGGRLGAGHNVRRRLGPRLLRRPALGCRCFGARRRLLRRLGESRAVSIGEGRGGLGDRRHLAWL